MSQEESKLDWLYKGVVPITVALIALIGVVLTITISYTQKPEKLNSNNLSNNKATENSEKNANYVIEVIRASASGINYIENAEVRLTIEGQPFQPDYTDKNGQVKFNIPLSNEGKEGQIIVTQNGRSRNQNITVKFNKITKIMVE